MAEQTIDVTASFDVEQPDGSTAPAKLTDLQVADPKAGPGALDASVLAVRDAMDQLLAALQAQGAGALGTEATLEGVEAAVLALGDPAQDATAAQIRDRLPALPFATQTAVLNAVGSTAFPIPQGAGTVQIVVLPNPAFVGVSALCDFSWDGGATYPGLTLLGKSPSASGSGAMGQFMYTAAAAGIWTVMVPPGATHIRVRITTMTSGSALIIAGFLEGASDPVTVIAGGNIGLGASGNRIGYVGAGGVWYDESAAPLGAGGAFTGPMRDLLGVVSGQAFSAGGASAGMQRLRLFAIANVAGTLCLEVSRDAVTWFRVRSVALDNYGTDVPDAPGAVWTASIDYDTAVRYARLAFVNGPAAQASFAAELLEMAA